MNVASLELCKKLYEISKDDLNNGWAGTNARWNEFGELSVSPYRMGQSIIDQMNSIPAYDIGYLLNKLDCLYPMIFKEKSGVISKKSFWAATLQDDDGLVLKMGDTPEDVACDLAIELFKQGILK